MVQINIRHIAAGKFAVLVLGFAHWVGCIFYWLARIAHFNNDADKATWLQQFYDNTNMDYGCKANGTILQTYAITLYKGLNGMANLGYDPTVPER